jgi:hypothetical protein
MPTPQDDLFSLTTLDPKWTYLERCGSPDLGYSLTANPGNFTSHVKAQSRNDALASLTRLVQDTIHPEFAIEIGITTAGVYQVGHESGLLIAENANNYIFFCKSYQSGGSRVRAYEMAGGLFSMAYDVAFTDDTNIVLRIVKFNNLFTLYYRRGEDSSFTAMPGTLNASAYGSGIGTGRVLGLGAVAGDAGAPTFDYLVNYFFFRRMQTVNVEGDSLLRVTTRRTVQGDMLLAVKNYPPVSGFDVKQYHDEPYNSIVWANPTGPGYLKTTVVRKEGSYPKSVSDGTVVLDASSPTTLKDGPFQTRARQFYSAFAVYSDKTTYAATAATMPVFVNLYRNVGKRFSRLFQKTVWATLYSFAKALQTFADVDLPSAMAQFNIHTATAEFLDLWGRLFGTRRATGEADSAFAERTVGHVIDPKTTVAGIVSAVRAIPGVTYCDLLDAASPSMFVGHSFIGFTGYPGMETKSCLVEVSFDDAPFYFVVRVKMHQGTDLKAILSAIESTRAGGTRFSVEILEVVS